MSARRGDVGDRCVKTDRETYGEKNKRSWAISNGSDYLERRRPLAPFFTDRSLLPKRPPKAPESR